MRDRTPYIKSIGVLLLSTTALWLGCIKPAYGQSSQPPTLPPAEMTRDAYSVDLSTGSFYLATRTLHLGRKDSGLSHVMYWNTGGFWRDEYEVFIVVEQAQTINKLTVTRGEVSDKYTYASGKFLSDKGDGSFVTQGRFDWILHLPDGTKIEFGNRVTGGSWNTYRATKISHSDGNVKSLVYEYTSYSPDPKEDPIDLSRLSEVISNNRYRIKYLYERNSINVPENIAQWLNHVGVAGINDADSSGRWIARLSKQHDKSPNSMSTRLIDIDGRVTAYGLDNSGRIITIKRPGSANHDVVIDYNEAGRVRSVTDASGITSYSYADEGALRTTRVTDVNGGMTSYVFDISTQKMLSRTDATGNVTRWQYDGNGRRTRETRPEGDATRYTYDTMGNVTETRSIAKPNSGVADIFTSASFPCASPATCDKPEWVRDANGHRTDFVYDLTTGNLTSVVSPPDAAGVRAITSYGYNYSGGTSRVSRIATCLTASTCTDSWNERVTEIGYNANGLPVTVSNRAGDASIATTTSMSYNAIGDLISVNGPLDGPSDTSHFRYDQVRRLVGEISPDPDGAGEMARRAVRTTYDPRGNATLIEQGTVTTPDDAGWSSFSSMQQVARTFDALDRPLSETMTAGGTVYSVNQSSYAGLRLDCASVRLNSAEWRALPTSACTAQTQTAAGPDRVSKFAYDAAGRLTRVTAAFGTAVATNEVTTAYTLNGNIASVTDANGNATTYTYDGLNRLVATTYPGGSIERLRLDANGNVVSRMLRDGNAIDYRYDAMGRVVSVVVPKLDGREYSRSYIYDLAGNLKRAIDASGHFVDLAHDGLGRQISETTNFSTRRFGYDAAGRRNRLTWEDGEFISYDYLATGEIQAIRENGGTLLARYGYDALGRRATLTRGNGVTTTYGFDAGSRLVSMAHDLAGSANDVTTTFTYNAAGQIINRTMSNPAFSWKGGYAVDRAYTANALNQYTQAGGISFRYDQRGNLIGSNTTAYGYTSENRLATGPGGYLAYDPLGRLYDENGRSTLQYDGTNLIAEQTAAGIARRYVFGPGIDEPIIWYEGAGLADKRWLVADEKGSVIAVTDAAGNATAINRYDEAGIPASTNVGRFQYTGQKWLTGFGLYDYKARTYSPTLGRFLQTDPIGYGDGMNMYAYAGNDPVNMTDPSGLAKKQCTFGNDGDVHVCASIGSEPSPNWGQRAAPIGYSYNVIWKTTSAYLFDSGWARNYAPGQQQRDQQCATEADRLGNGAGTVAAATIAGAQGGPVLALAGLGIGVGVALANDLLPEKFGSLVDSIGGVASGGMYGFLSSQYDRVFKSVFSNAPGVAQVGGGAVSNVAQHVMRTRALTGAVGAARWGAAAGVGYLGGYLAAYQIAYNACRKGS